MSYAGVRGLRPGGELEKQTVICEHITLNGIEPREIRDIHEWDNWQIHCLVCHKFFDVVYEVIS